MNKGVFYDRDGIIIKLVYDLENGVIDTPKKISQVHFINGILPLLMHTSSLGYKNIIVSNQPAIGTKKISLKNFNSVKEYILEVLNKEKGLIDGEYYCLHHPHAQVKKYQKKCHCRKPEPGLLYQASKDLDIDLSSSWMIGDSVNDVLAGSASGCRTILLANLYESEYLRILEKNLDGVKPNYLVKNILEVINIIKK